MRCPFCSKTIAKKDSFCRYCGEAIPAEAKVSLPPSPWHSTDVPSPQDKSTIIAEAYQLLMGDEYMHMIGKLFELNPEKAIEIMRGDVGVRMGSRPKKTPDEIDKELEDFFNDPVTRQRLGKSRGKEDDSATIN